MSTIPLSFTDLAMAAAFILLNGLLSMVLNLGIAGRLLVAATRTVVQLLLIGLVLKTIFSLSDPLWTAVAALVMMALAGREALARQARPLAGFWAYGIGTSAMMTAGGIITLFTLTVLIGPEPWYTPRYALPLLGMILGNTMSGVALGLNTLTTLARKDRSAVEARLALGETRLAALNHVIREALRNALMPIVNSMSAAGIVSLPGMMTGQILAGADPVEATKYQVLMMFLIAGGTGLGTVTAVMLASLRLTDSRHRLRLDRLRPAQPPTTA